MKRLILSGVIAAAAVGSLNAALTQSFYTGTSLLNSGKWVKVGVEQTGVYEISYETLRSMGFSDPSKVSVYGRGGRTLPESFVSNAGVPILTDDVAPVKVIHEDNMLYFYGLGPEEITFETNADYTTGGYFSRKGNNIYTKRGYYFLTDSKSPSKMTVKTYDTSSSPRIEQGVGFIYHELDSVQNTTGSGQLFWGESLNLPDLPVRLWDVTMPDAVEGQGVMECVIYMPDADFGDAKIIYGFEGTDYFSVPYTESGSLYYAPHNPTLAEIPIPGSKGTVKAGVEGAEDMRDYANLDYWVVSYPAATPTLRGADGSRLSQQLMAFPSVGKNSTSQLQIADPASLVVLDVTTVTDPQRLTVKQQGALGTVGVHNTNKTPVIVVFDKNQPQLQISGYEEAYTQIENQNLHGYKNQGADFVIITTPRLKAYAEEIAQLHRDHDGIKVIVATTEECYNEFSGGTPDPMAYRSFARMLYFSECKPKNMLLLGPLYGDFRGLQKEHDPLDGIIAYQSPSISITRGAHNINDFYGMMSDKFRTDYYERNDVQIGVAILPVKFESEAHIVVDKIRKYLERDDHAYYLNKYTAIGGLGDQHTHDIQVRDLSDFIRTMDYKGTMYTPLAIDTYGNKEARKKFLNSLNEGGNMFSYFGHGAEQFLGKDKNFFSAGDVYTLRNTTLPFALFGGCQITNTDRGFRGLGEIIVTGTPYGCIGSIVSARDTWSGQNLEFFKQFFTCLYTEGSTTTSPHRANPVTLGEVYASVKHYSTYSNELSYQLLCDPALVFPTINRMVTLDGGSQLVPGNNAVLSGKVMGADGKSTDTGFNGQIVVRLAEPAKTVKAGMIETKEDPLSLTYTYRDTQVAMATADVKNGAFTVNLHVPGNMSSFEGQDAILYLSAYNPANKVGAASGLELTVAATPAGGSEEAGDVVPPVIEQLAFDAETCAVSFAASDNVALNLSTSPLNKGVFLFIDGRERTEAHFVEPKLESDRPAFSKTVLVDGLAYGEHTARLKVKDAAGNATEQEITFTYNPAASRYALARGEESGPESTVINVVGAAPAASTLIVLSSEGNEVWRADFTGSTVEWNHEGTDGGRVPAGHYKAYIIETGSGMQKGHSEPIDIPVI